MTAVCFYFQVHQPYRIQELSPFGISENVDYFNHSGGHARHNNKAILDKVSEKCYLPTNALLLELLEAHPEFSCSFSFSGVVLEQLEQWRPDVLLSFQRLIDTGRVEVLAETYYHSLSFIYSPDEFRRQVVHHGQTVERLFGVTPQVFRNTELIYNNDIAQYIESMGYAGILTEGADKILQGRSPNQLYSPVGTNKIRVLLKNYALSDDIAFRFSSLEWDQHPLTASKFASWVSGISHSDEADEIVNLFMDYESFGEHQWESSGIFEFLRHLPAHMLEHSHITFITPSQAVAHLPVRDTLDIPQFISWADEDRDLSAWLSNEMQAEAFMKIYALENRILGINDPSITEDWRRMQISDHFYYMCTKFDQDGSVHTYFSPYISPQQAFVYYINAYRNLVWRVEQQEKIQQDAIIHDYSEEQYESS